MAEDKKAPARNELLDTKFGTVAPASIEALKDRKDGDYVKAKFISVGGKEIDIYARGKNIDVLKAKAEAGEPFLATGELLAKGKGLSLSAVDGKVYNGTVEEITKEGTNEYGAWAAVKLKVAGKDKAWPVLLTGDDVAKAAKGKDIEVNLVWTAGQRDGRWSTSAVSANSLMRARKEPEASPAP
ncbi:hypothetical protein ACEUZ9_000912 [Paracoccus litorisediminis]|uniref:hypothetical protein n=1 Tax=Paracoccus litorisediminis TaxID=2006130 RepID=UPI003731E620